MDGITTGLEGLLKDGKIDAKDFDRLVTKLTGGAKDGGGKVDDGKDGDKDAGKDKGDKGGKDNRPPVFERFPDGGKIHLTEGKTFAYDFKSGDPDGDKVTYSLTGKADGDKFTISPKSGHLVFKDAPNHAHPSDGNGDNVYDVEVKLTDEHGLTTTKTVWVKVGERAKDDDGDAPHITNKADKGIYYVHEGTTAVTTFEASETNVTWSLTNKADGRFFEIDAATGALSFKEAPDFENPQDLWPAIPDNIYDAEIVVTDEHGNTSKCDIWVKVKDKDDKPDTPPEGKVNIGFDDLAAGTIVSDQFDGVTITATRPGSTENVAMVFDADNPTGGDEDLGVGGQGKVLIISEDGDSADPDDNARGGTFRIDFDEPTSVESLRLIDIEEAGGTITIAGAPIIDPDTNTGTGGGVSVIEIPAAGDRSVQTIALNATNVDFIEVTLTGSGAIDDLCLVKPEKPTEPPIEPPVEPPKPPVEPPKPPVEPPVEPPKPPVEPPVVPPKPPHAEDDKVFALGGETITINALTNDTDPEGQTLTVTNVGDATNGTVTLNADGTITYAANADFTGDDAFTYTITDEDGLTSQATVTVCVEEPKTPPPPPPPPPHAEDDKVNAWSDETINFDPRANDSDPEGQALTVTDVEQPANGTVTIEADGTLSYVSNAGFEGNDTFTYTITDEDGLTDTATVTVCVEKPEPPEVPNDPPLAEDDKVFTDPGTAVTIEPLVNDTDPNGDPLSIVAVGTSSNGTVTLNADGTIGYVPNEGFTGNDTFSYTISDGRGGADYACITVCVEAPEPPVEPPKPPVEPPKPPQPPEPPAPPPPHAEDDKVFALKGESVRIEVLANDTDPEGQALTVTDVGEAANGTVTLDADGTITYAANADFAGDDTFTYTITDEDGLTDTATVTVCVEEPVKPEPPVEPPLAAAAARAARRASQASRGAAQAAAAAGRASQTSCGRGRQGPLRRGAGRLDRGAGQRHRSRGRDAHGDRRRAARQRHGRHRGGRHDHLHARCGLCGRRHVHLHDHGRGGSDRHRHRDGVHGEADAAAAAQAQRSAGGAGRQGPRRMRQGRPDRGAGQRRRPRGRRTEGDRVRPARQGHGDAERGRHVRLSRARRLPWRRDVRLYRGRRARAGGHGDGHGVRGEARAAGRAAQAARGASQAPGRAAQAAGRAPRGAAQASGRATTPTPPTGQKDGYFLKPGLHYILPVLHNDRGEGLSIVGIDGQGLAKCQSIRVEGGIVTLRADGQLVFKGNRGTYGDVEFTYTTIDAYGNKAQTEVCVCLTRTGRKH